VGLALGLVIIVALAKFPGEPFDYSQIDGVHRGPDAPPEGERGERLSSC
jgi:hypothetical protein